MPSQPNKLHQNVVLPKEDNSSDILVIGAGFGGIAGSVKDACQRVFCYSS